MNTLKKEKLYKYDELYKMINFINENSKTSQQTQITHAYPFKISTIFIFSFNL